LISLFTYFRRIENLSTEAEKAILPLCKRVKSERNTILQPIGHSCKTIYFLEKGMARIFYFKEHVDITESFSFENQLVVRFESLFTGKPSQKGIELLENADLIAIDAAKLFKLYDLHPDIERLFRKITEAALVEQINRIESLQFHTAEERYKFLLSESPDILKRVPLKHIASYLGITAVSLSRIRASR
jgi:CRP-like cAMP-binding protein